MSLFSSARLSMFGFGGGQSKYRTEPMLYESHMHTPLCKHAVGQPEEYARRAEQRNLKGIIVTCHNPIPSIWGPQVRMDISQFDNYVAMVKRARKEFEYRVDVRLGMETDYVPGMEKWIRELHSRAEFHHVLGSVHPQIPEYRERYFKGDWVAFQELYFEHLAMAAESGLFDTLAHPDLVKNCSPENWNLERSMEAINQALDRIAATGVSMELNTSGVNKSIPEMNPNPTMLEQMCRRGIPVVIGADAHQPKRVGDGYVQALYLLLAAGYHSVGYFIERQRQEVDILDALRSLGEAVPEKV